MKTCFAIFLLGMALLAGSDRTGCRSERSPPAKAEPGNALVAPTLVAAL